MPHRLMIIDKLKEIKKAGIFAELSDESLTPLAECSRLTKKKQGEIIYDVGDLPDALYLVVEGHVRYDVPAREGQEIFLSVAPPTIVFGEQELLSQTTSIARVSTIGDTLLLTLPQAEFLVLFNTEIKLAQALTRQMAFSSRLLSYMMAYQITSSIDTKLAGLLLQLGVLIGKEHKVGSSEQSILRIELKLSQDEIANMLGVTRQSVNKYLQRWKREGWIRIEEGYLELIDVNKLLSETDLRLPF